MTTAVSNNVQAPFDPTASSTPSTVVNGQLGKEDFLSLLVAQLSHQDPMSPTDPTQFVSQLSQFSSLEQLMNLKEGLDLLAVTQTAGTSAQMVSFIGKRVVYEGGEVTWHTGDAPRDVQFQLGDSPSTVSVTLRDAAGNAVDQYEVTGAVKGENSLTFTGKTHPDGSALPAGQYSVEITAKDVDGNTIKVTQQATGQVAGVTFEHGYPEIVLADGTTLALGQVIKVLEGEPADAATVTASSDDDGATAVSSAPQLHFPTSPTKTPDPGSAPSTLPTPDSHPRR